MAAHPSDSSAQLEAERAIVEALSAELGQELVPGGTVVLADGVTISLDAHSVDRTIAVEAYAHQGSLRGAQQHKVARDVLKLALLRRVPGHSQVRPIIAMASEEALASVSRWVRHAATEFDVELHAVNLGPDLVERLVAAQQRQRMVNAPGPDAPTAPPKQR